jgi:hypothetical protein
MEHDDLKLLWKETGQRLASMEPLLRLNARLAQAGIRDRSRSKLRFVHVVLWYEVCFAAAAVLLIGAYLPGSLSTPRIAIPAAALMAAAVLNLAGAVRQLVALNAIDYAGPVVAIQRALAEIRAMRARSNRRLLRSAPLLWALAVIVVPHALAGLDPYQAFGLPWIAGNLAVGLAVMAAAAWASRRLPPSSRRLAFVRWLGDDLAGRKVAEASGFLADIAAFEAETT